MIKNILKLDKQEFFIETLNDSKTTIVNELAQIFTERQKIPEFNTFLKEIPTNEKNNEEFIKSKLSGNKSVAKVLKDIRGEIVGVLFLHGFDEVESSLEASLRISPHLHGKGIGTALKRLAIKEVLEFDEIKQVTSWHSCGNIGTFFTNKKCGGKIVEFKENNTFLPNKGEFTDDFKRVITDIVDGKTDGIDNIIGGDDPESIKNGLKKHMNLDLNG